MCSIRMWAGFVAAMAVVTTNVTAWAALPNDRTITYAIHETPTDPLSAVVFIVRLDASAVVAGVDEDSIGWDITSATFTQPDAGGDTVWTVVDPALGTPDGLWWVDHADIHKPTLGEFVLPPALVGTANPADPLDDDLEYDLVGVSYPGRLPYNVTARLDYTFALAAEPETPIEDGQEDPVDVDDDNTGST